MIRTKSRSSWRGPAHSRRRTGAVSFLMALSFTGFVTLLAVVVDLSWVYVEEAQTVRASTAAAISATLARGRGLDEEQSRQVALSFAGANGLVLEEDDLTFDPLENNARLCRMSTFREVPLFFSPVLGLAQLGVGHQIYALSSHGAVQTFRELPTDRRASGMIPIGVAHAHLIGVLEGTITTAQGVADHIFGSGEQFGVGDRVLLKSGNQFQSSFRQLTGEAGSNQGAIEFPGTGSGASVYQEVFELGHGGWVSVGDRMDSQPGSLTGPTRDATEARFDQDPDTAFTGLPGDVLPFSSRLVIVPIVRALVSGPNDMGTGIDDLGRVPQAHSGRITVETIGFGKFFLDDYSQSLGNGVVTGRFVEYLGIPPDGQNPG